MNFVSFFARIKYLFSLIRCFDEILGNKKFKSDSPKPLLQEDT
jgi:hypothetical protein